MNHKLDHDNYVRLEIMIDTFNPDDTPTSSLIRDIETEFILIPRSEVNAVEIEDTGKTHGTTLIAGSGPETIRANTGSNPNWLYNSAVNALAMEKYLRNSLQGKPVPVTPPPGWIGDPRLATPGTLVLPPLTVGASEVVSTTVHASGNPMLWYFGTDKTASRIDLPGGTGWSDMDQRERQIALALTDLAANALRKESI